LFIAQFIDGGACVMYVETSVHYRVGNFEFTHRMQGLVVIV